MDARGEKARLNALCIWNDRLSQEGEDKVPPLKVSGGQPGGHLMGNPDHLKKKNSCCWYSARLTSESGSWNPHRKARHGWECYNPSPREPETGGSLSLLGHGPGQCNTCGMIPELVLWLPRVHAYIYKCAYIHMSTCTHMNTHHTHNTLTNTACSMVIALLANYFHSTHFLHGEPLLSFQNHS